MCEISLRDLITDPLGEDLKNLAIIFIDKHEKMARSKSRIEFSYKGEDYVAEIMIKKGSFELPEDHIEPEDFEDPEEFDRSCFLT